MSGTEPPERGPADGASRDELRETGPETGGGAVRAALDARRRQEVGRLAGLRRTFDDVVEASRDSNADDEHDPEGATIAFERSQVSALAEQSRRRLAEIDAALRRVDEGTYGRCEACGGPIAAGRLEARPDARTCVACAGRPPPR